MTHPTPPPPPLARTVEEVPRTGLPALVHPEWEERFAWLVQGTTRATENAATSATSATSEPGEGPAEPFDLGLFSDASPPRDVLARWDVLRLATGMSEIVHAHQVHGASVRWHRAGAPGLHLLDPCDGHATTDAGILLAVTVADCVPVFVVDPRRRAAALVHAGWRGTAAGILERGVAVLAERAGSRPADVHVHLGPAICGSCYEVGPEVFSALGLEAPRSPAPLDLRAVLALRAVSAGVAERRITLSAHCTRCGVGLFSHRGGDRARQAGFLGIRAP
ncbi:MAG: polyphenol oxidase family protein [Gemmatimonadetes bacterium]|nr:polyphenol oxidase family protein [Gemmatimonadota bacterium]